MKTKRDEGFMRFLGEKWGKKIHKINEWENEIILMLNRFQV